MIRVGLIARPHGVRGAVVVTLDNPSSDSLFGVDHVHLGAGGQAPARFEVRRAGPGRKGQVILVLDGVETPEAVDALRGREVLLDEAQLPALEEHEFWIRDLVGLAAFDSDGTSLGRVEEVVDTAEVPVLIVRDGKDEAFVPFSDPYVVEVDLQARRIVVAPVESA
ncbi:ribosome maturation factor RimM [Vulgatibacter incomptus]|uniref:Ribosome maturation factor RimM n=1 Tax=Vulgatibacter incomptus TaxID=1391653 RepID=A0A0K1PDU5_9BACT|nr:ribosome maturation factor RimM [Vulgatibacter incomptus]AKU91284.1 16S rRNA processing protein RimM [Vulgatibacter incomptus]